MKPSMISSKNEETLLQKSGRHSTEIKETGKKHIWRYVIIGGIPGITLGSAGTAFASDIVHVEGKQEDNPHNDASVSNEDIVPEDVMLVSSVNDDKSFGEAFAVARSEVGAGGVFKWHGQLYSTYTKEEWLSMTDEQKDDFAEKVAGIDIPHTSEEDVNGEGHCTAQGGAHTAGTNTEVTAEEFETHGGIVDGKGEAVEVEVVEAGRIDVGDGESIAAVAARIDGHDSLFVDADNDGYVDVILVDSNDDGELQEGEVINVQDTDMHMTELASAEELGYNTPENDIFANTPDYTNDADVSSLA